MMRALLLVVLLALWPMSARAENLSAPQLAEATSACLDREIRERVIGRTWVEITGNEQARVAMTMRYPGRWQGDVFSWIDITRIAVGPDHATPLNDDLYRYLMMSFGHEYQIVHGGYRDEALALHGHDCVRWGLYGN